MNATAPAAHRLSALALALLAALALAACTGAQTQKDRPVGPPAFGPDLRPGHEAPQDAAWRAWVVKGSTAEAFDLVSLEDDGAALEPAALLLRAELRLHRGMLSAAFTDLLTLVRKHAEHPIADSAALSLWQLRDEVPNWPEDIHQLHVDLVGKPADPSLRARLAFMRLHAEWGLARRAGDAPLLDAAPLGFPQRWRLLEPVDIFAALGWESRHKLDGHAVMPDTIDINGFQRRPRSIIADGPGANITFRYTGVHALEAWMQLDADTEAIVQLVSPSSIALDIDGQLLVDRAPGSGMGRSRFAEKVKLGRGLHRLRVTLATVSGGESFTLLISPTDGRDLNATFMERPAEASPALGALTRAESKPLRSAFEPLDAETARGHAVLLWLLARTATEAGEFGQAGRALLQLRELAPSFPGLWVAGAQLGASDTTGPPQARYEGQASALRKALELDPEAHMAALRLASLLATNSQLDDALALLTRLEAAMPQEFALRWRLFQLFRDRGWTPDAEAALRAALELNPTDCRLINARWDAWERLQTWPRVEDIPADFFGCDSTWERLARFSDLPAGRIDQAIARYRALIHRNPSGAEYRVQLATLLTGAGRHEEAEQAFLEAIELSPNSSDNALLYVDSLIARGQEKAAAAYLEQRLQKSPGNYSLRRRLYELRREPVLGDLDVDGLAIIRDYLKKPTGLDASAVYVLDFAATRVFDDGANLTLTHNIIRVLNKEGIDQFAEVDIPGNALLLFVRTVKPDGSTLDPEPIPGKPTISMPGLEAGDFIEYAYLQGNDGSLLRRGAYLGFRWFFNIFDAALLRSEYTLELPSSFEPVIDSRNNPPQAEKTVKGEVTRLRFLSVDGPRVSAEPSPSPSSEFLPSIQIASRFRWLDLHRTWRDSLLINAAPTDLLRDTLIDALGDTPAEASQAEITRALYGWVKEELTDDESGLFAQPASHVVATSSGDRLLVLHVLLNLAGVPNEILVARPAGADLTDPPVPSLDAYSVPVLRVTLDTGEVFLDPSSNHTPFGYIPPWLHGARAFRLGPMPEDAADADFFVALPTPPDTAELRTVEITIDVDKDGNATAVAEESWRGSVARALRTFLTSSNDLEPVNQELNRTLGPSFPGLQLRDLTFDNIKDDSKPLIMRYTFASRGLARKEGGALVIDRPQLTTDLTNTFATLPERKLPLAINAQAFTDTTLVYRFPEGFKVRADDAQAAVEAPFGRLSAEPGAQGQPNQLTLKRALRLPIQRIAPTDYGAFREFARAVDDAERFRISASPGR